MRLRWPFVQKALTAAADVENIPADVIENLAETMEKVYKSVFTEVTEDTLQGGLAIQLLDEFATILICMEVDTMLMELAPRHYWQFVLQQIILQTLNGILL